MCQMKRSRKYLKKYSLLVRNYFLSSAAEEIDNKMLLLKSFAGKKQPLLLSSS